MIAKTSGRGRRGLLAAYLTFVLLVAVTGPGLAVYGADEGVEPVEPVVEAVAPEAPADPAPVAEVPVEPVAEPEPELGTPPEVPAVEAPAPLGPAPEPVAAPTVSPAVVEDVPPEPGPAFPALTDGGVRIFGPGSGTYSADTVDAIAEPVPDDFELTLQVFTTVEGTFVSFHSTHPVAKVVVCGGEAGSNVYWLGGALDGSWLHAPAVEATYVTPCGMDVYFCEQAVGGCLDVYKFEDHDRDGQHDDGEDMLEGVQFLLYDAEGTRVGCGRTDSAGRLRFRGLPEGTYAAEEVLPEGWNNTTPLRQCALVCAGRTSALCFGNVRETAAPETGLLSVYLFHDLNKDGVRQAAEPLLSGWQCSIRDDHGEEIDELGASAVSNTTHELPAGVYTLQQALNTGWTGTTALQRTATVVAGQETVVWFGVVQVASTTPVATTVADPGTRRTGPFLPFTGSEYLLLLGAGVLSGAGGLALRVPRRRA